MAEARSYEKTIESGDGRNQNIQTGKRVIKDERMVGSDEDSDIRILLVGQTGHGKSTTGNAITGEKTFETSGGSSSKTVTCQWSKQILRFGKYIEVVDTPEFHDTKFSPRETLLELMKAVIFTAPGFHAIAFVLRRGRITEKIIKTMKIIFDWFGPGVGEYACLILTDTNEEELQEFLTDYPGPQLEDLVSQCGRRVIAFAKENEGSTDKQVKNLFDAIETMKQKNTNPYFTNVAFKLAETYARTYQSKDYILAALKFLQESGYYAAVTIEQLKHFNRQVQKISTPFQSAELESGSDQLEDKDMMLVHKGVRALQVATKTEPKRESTKDIHILKNPAALTQVSNTHRQMVRVVSGATCDTSRNRMSSNANFEMEEEDSKLKAGETRESSAVAMSVVLPARKADIESYKKGGMNRFKEKVNNDEIEIPSLFGFFKEMCRKTKDWIKSLVGCTSS